jgi:hypothetical protein
VGPVIAVVIVGLFSIALQFDAPSHASSSVSRMLLLVLPITAFVYVLLTCSRSYGVDRYRV